jgi:hypothetical protein
LTLTTFIAFPKSVVQMLGASERPQDLGSGCVVRF